LAGEIEVLGKNLPRRHFVHHTNSTCLDPGLNPGRRGGKPATNRLRYGVALVTCLVFLIRIIRGGVQLGPLGTSATTKPIVPTLGDYDDGEVGGIMIGRGNRGTRRKRAPMPHCPSQTPHAARTRTWATAVESERLTF
jgi:hypothetical protein